MEIGNIFDLKVFGYMLVNTQGFSNNDEKNQFEKQLKQVLKELSQIKKELDLLYQSEEDDFDLLIKQIRERIRMLPKETATTGFYDFDGAVVIPI